MNDKVLPALEEIGVPLASLEVEVFDVHNHLAGRRVTPESTKPSYLQRLAPGAVRVVGKVRKSTGKKAGSPTKATDETTKRARR